MKRFKKEIIIKLTEEESKYIEEFYNKNFDMIVNFCLRKTNNMDDSLDIAQDVFTLYVSKMREIQKEKARAWIYITAQNKIYEYYREPSKNDVSIDDEIINKVKSISVEDEFFIGLMDVEKTKNEVLNLLDDGKRKQYNDYFVEKISHSKASEKYNISVLASKVRKTRLKQEILDILKKTK